MDETLVKLEVLHNAYVTAHDSISAALLESMIQLYIIGRIDIDFSKRGEPIATPINYSHPMITDPMFAIPGGVTKRQIGFSVN